jgi:hypothetical protein
VAGEPGKVAVGHDFSVRHMPQGARDVELESRPPLELELDVVEGNPLPAEVVPESLDQLFRCRRTSVADLCAFRL